MARTLSTNNQTGVAEDVTRPIYLVEIGFSSPLRLSNRDTVTFDGNTFTNAALTVSLTPPTATLRLFNDQLTYSPLFVANGPGASITIYEVFGEGPFNAADADIYFYGETGPASIADEITFTAVEKKINVPRVLATNNIFSRLPADGTQIQTRSGVVTLSRRS